MACSVISVRRDTLELVATNSYAAMDAATGFAVRLIHANATITGKERHAIHPNAHPIATTAAPAQRLRDTVHACVLHTTEAQTAVSQCASHRVPRMASAAVMACAIAIQDGAAAIATSV